MNSAVIIVMKGKERTHSKVYLFPSKQKERKKNLHIFYSNQNITTKRNEFLAEREKQKRGGCDLNSECRYFEYYV